MGKAPDEWSYGDLDAGFASAAIVVDETFVVQSTGHQPMESRSAMAYWQNGKLFLHGSTQSVARTLDPLAGWLGIDASNIVLDQRVLRWRLREQRRRRRVDGDSGAAVEEGRRAGHDADQPRRRALHRPRAHRHGRPREGRLQQGRPHHRARSLHRRGQRIVRADGRLSIGGAGRVAHLAADRDAVARARRADEHAAAIAAALAGTDAGERDHGAGRHEGGEQAGDRSGGDPPDQFAGGQGVVRSRAAERPAGAHYERVRERGARPRRGALQVGRAQGALRQAAGVEGARRRRRRRTARVGIDRLRRPHDASA